MAQGLRPLLAAAAVLTAVVGTSCGNGSATVRVLEGNSAYGRGDYQMAILRYLAAEAETGGDIVLYDLADVYYALGEGSAALEAWSRAEEATDDQEVLYRIAFNRGVLYYQWGRYDEAYRSFRRALTLKPASLDAKANLEASLSRIRSAAISQEAPPVAAGTQTIREEDSARLLDFVRRKEAGEWTSTDGSSDSASRDW